LQFYPRDWLADTRALSPEANGAWIDVLCALHFSPTRGKLAMTWEGWARSIGQSPEKTRACVDELTLFGTCDHTECNGVVTLICRRMLRESITKEQTRLRVAKLRDKERIDKRAVRASRNGNAQCNATVPKCNAEEAQKLISSESILAPAAPPRERNPLFDALASACGSDPLQMTAPAARACGVALAAILKVAPTTKPEEFVIRAGLYRQLYPKAALTPSALCGHWSECRADNPQIKNATDPNTGRNTRSFSQRNDYSGVLNKGTGVAPDA
jgi:hypothetical protein